MEGRQKYTLSLKNVQLYTPGTYQMSCHILSDKSSIQFDVQEANTIHEQPTTLFKMKPFYIGKNITQLPDLQLTANIDSNNYPDPVYLHVDVSKLKSTTDGEPSSSLHPTEFERCYEGRAGLQQHGGMFLSDTNDVQESTYCGTLKLWKVLEGASVRVCAGWITYLLVVSLVEDELPRDGVPATSPSVNEVLTDHQGVDLQSSPHLQSPDIALPDMDHQKAVSPVEDALDITPPKHSNSASFTPKLHEDGQIDMSGPGPASPSKPEQQKEDPLKNSISLHTPDAPLSCSNVLVDLPNINAIKQLLPKYHALECKPPQKQLQSDIQPHVPIREPETRLSLRAGEGKSRGSYTFTPTPDHLTLSPHTKESLDVHVVAVLDYQSKELDRYRGVIQRMGSDILKLRNEISALQDSKDELIMKLYYAGEGANAAGDSDTEVVQLRRGLAAERESKNDLQKRVHTLQNQLIKKNETEASFVELEAAHKVQQKVLLDLQNKMTKYKLLEETVKKQELVIERMEDRLKKEKSGENVNKSATKPVPAPPTTPPTPEATNVRKLHKKGKGANKDKTISFQPSADPNAQNMQWNASMIEEKVHLMQRVEHAERTVAALEEQLYNNSRQWAKERSAMQRSLMGATNSQNITFPQKMLTSGPLDQNMNYMSEPYKMGNIGSRFGNSLQFPPYTYQHQSNSSWKMP